MVDVTTNRDRRMNFIRFLMREHDRHLLKTGEIREALISEKKGAGHLGSNYVCL